MKNRNSIKLRYSECGHTCDDPSGPQEDDDSENVDQTAGKNTVPRPEKNPLRHKEVRQPPGGSHGALQVKQRHGKLFKISINFVQCTESSSSNPHTPPFWLKVNSFYLVLGKKLVFILRLPSVQILGWTLAAASVTPTSFCPKRNHENRSLCRSKSLL